VVAAVRDYGVGACGCPFLGNHEDDGAEDNKHDAHADGGGDEESQAGFVSVHLGSPVWCLPHPIPLTQKSLPGFHCVGPGAIEQSVEQVHIALESKGSRCDSTACGGLVRRSVSRRAVA